MNLILLIAPQSLSMDAHCYQWRSRQKICPVFMVIVTTMRPSDQVCTWTSSGNPQGEGGREGGREGGDLRGATAVAAVAAAPEAQGKEAGGALSTPSLSIAAVVVAVPPKAYRKWRGREGSVRPFEGGQL